MEQNGLYDEQEDLRSVEVKFVVAYETKWGEAVAVTGSRGLLGAGEVERGVRMKCTHGCHGLLWEACVTVPPRYACDYHYVVVDEQSGAVIRRESGQHQLVVEPGAAGSCIMLSDHFQVRCHLRHLVLCPPGTLLLCVPAMSLTRGLGPVHLCTCACVRWGLLHQHLQPRSCVQTLSDVETIYKTSAFRDAIFQDKAHVQNALPHWEHAGPGLITVRFSVQCAVLPVAFRMF